MGNNLGPCPACGFDLKEEENSGQFECRNCDSVFCISSIGVRFSRLPEFLQDGNKVGTAAPFEKALLTVLITYGNVKSWPTT